MLLIELTGMNFPRIFSRKRWEKRSLNAHLADPRGQAMYSVIHGGIDKILRKKSTTILSNLPFDGHAIGMNKIRYVFIFIRGEYW